MQISICSSKTNLRDISNKSYYYNYRVLLLISLKCCYREIVSFERASRRDFKPIWTKSTTAIVRFCLFSIIENLNSEKGEKIDFHIEIDFFLTKHEMYFEEEKV